MKILHPLLLYYPSQAGGPANALYWINKNLNKNIFTTSVVSTYFGVRDCDKKTANQNTKNNYVCFYSTKGFSFLRKSILEAIKCDIVQFSSIFFPPTLPIIIIAITNKKAVIISPRGELYSPALNNKPIVKEIWLRLIGLFQSKIHFHATSLIEKELIEQRFPNSASVTLMPNFIELPIKKELKVLKQILFIGRINPIKNIDILIKVMFHINKDSSEKTKLIILGSARLEIEKVYLTKLKQLVLDLNLENLVEFLGHIQGEEKQSILASSYALVLPSKSENFGNVVLEAMAQGTPVIASKGTPWKLLEETKTGYWVEATEKSLTIALTEILAMKDAEYYSLRKKVYSLCKDKFDIKTNITSWENYYMKIN